MNQIQLDAFADEMEKISASMLLNVGRWARPQLGGLKTAPDRVIQATKHLVRNPVDAVRQGWRATVDPKLGQGGGRMAVALTGLGTAAGLAMSAPKRDPTGQGDSRLTRLTSTIGGTLTGLAGSRYGMIPGIALGVGGDFAGRAVGRTVDKLRGYKRQPEIT